MKEKENTFDIVFEDQKQQLANKFDKLIQRLKLIKIKYEKKMTEKYLHIKHIFTFIRVLCENYLININNYAINEFPIYSLSHLEYLKFNV